MISLYKENDDEKDDALNDVKLMFREYFNELNLDWSWQGIEDELAGLPGKYSNNEDGFIYIAHVNNKAAGCIALRRLEENIGEIKRLYVRQEYRGKYGLASKLMQALLDKAKELGYKELKLDTLKRLKAANALYKKFNFKEIDSYNYHPIEDCLFYGIDLQ